jgi:hypothetical protein
MLKFAGFVSFFSFLSHSLDNGLENIQDWLFPHFCKFETLFNPFFDNVNSLFQGIKFNVIP